MHEPRHSLQHPGLRKIVPWPLVPELMQILGISTFLSITNATFKGRRARRWPCWACLRVHIICTYIYILGISGKHLKQYICTYICGMSGKQHTCDMAQRCSASMHKPCDMDNIAVCCELQWIQCVAVNAVCWSGLPGTSPMPELTPERSERSDEPVTNITTKYCITYTHCQYQNNIKRRTCRAIAFWNLLLWFWFISWCVCTQTDKHTCAFCVHVERERERESAREREEREEREREKENITERASERAS